MGCKTHARGNGVNVINVTAMSYNNIHGETHTRSRKHTQTHIRTHTHVRTDTHIQTQNGQLTNKFIDSGLNVPIISLFFPS